MALKDTLTARTLVVFGMAASLGLGIGAGPTVASHLIVRSNDIVNGEVKTADLDGGAVTTQKLRDGAVTKRKLANTNKVMWAIVDTAAEAGGGTIVAQSGGISVVGGHSFVGQRLHFPRSVQGKAIIATPITSALDSPPGAATVKVRPCGPGPVSTSYASCTTPAESPKDLLAIAHLITDTGGSQQSGVDYYIAVLP